MKEERQAVEGFFQQEIRELEEGRGEKKKKKRMTHHKSNKESRVEVCVFVCVCSKHCHPKRHPPTQHPVPTATLTPCPSNTAVPIATRYGKEAGGEEERKCAKD